MNKKLLLLTVPMLAPLLTLGACASRTDHMFNPPSISPVGDMRNPMPATAARGPPAILSRS